MYVKRNMEARSCNHYCSGKAMSVTCCVFVDIGSQHEMCMCCIFIYGLPLYSIFPHYLKKQYDFRKQLLNTKYVFTQYHTPTTAQHKMCVHSVSHTNICSTQNVCSFSITHQQLLNTKCVFTQYHIPANALIISYII
jgi:hypothetical protein